MAKIMYTHCHHCGDRLANHSEAYCPPCNLYLAYRAMPILLGMLLTGPPSVKSAFRANIPRTKTREDYADIFPCRSRLCGVSPSVTELCECTARKR